MKLQFKTEKEPTKAVNLTLPTELAERISDARDEAPKLKIAFAAMLTDALTQFMDEYEAELSSQGKHRGKTQAKGQGKAAGEAAPFINGQG